MSKAAYRVQSKGVQQFILVESSGEDMVPRNASKADIKKVAKELSEHTGPISAVANTVYNALAAVNNPTEIELEFGLELGGEAGIPTILSGSTKANFKITLTWKNEKGKHGE